MSKQNTQDPLANNDDYEEIIIGRNEHAIFSVIRSKLNGNLNRVNSTEKRFDPQKDSFSLFPAVSSSRDTKQKKIAGEDV